MLTPGDLYAAIEDDAVYAGLPAMVAEYVGGRSGLTYRVERGGKVSDFQFSYFSSAMMSDLQSRFANGGDIWTEAGVRSGIIDRATPVDELVSEAEFRCSPLWNDFFRLHGDDTGHSLGLVHQFDGGLMITSIHRALVAGAFTASEAARLDAIGMDLHRVYRTRELLAASTRRSRRLGALLDAHQDSVFMVDVSMRLVEASTSARRLLEAEDGFRFRNGHIVLIDECTAGAVCRAVADTIHRRPVGRASFLCQRPSGSSPWRLIVLPTDDDEGLCLLLVGRREKDLARRRRWLQDCFSLTRTELEIADGLLAAQTADEIANLRRTSLATVRTHIRHLLEKTDTRRISAFVALVLSLP